MAEAAVPVASRAVRVLVGAVAGGLAWLVAGIALLILSGGDCTDDCRPEPWLDVTQRILAGLWLLSPVLVLVAVAVRRGRGSRGSSGAPTAPE